MNALRRPSKHGEWQVAVSALLIAFLLSLSGTPGFAQDFTHPQQMGLPQSNFMRPDPAEYELKLDNGLIAYIAEASQVPLVTMTAFIRAGKIDDEQQGAAEALHDALASSGPESMLPDDFRQTIERMTARFQVEFHDEWAEVSLNVPKEDFATALSLFADLLRTPGISAMNIERAAMSSRAAANDLGGESGPALYEGTLDAAVEKFYEEVYRNHAYGTRPSRRSFANLQVDDVAGFHARYFVPGNLTLAIAGDIDVEQTQTSVAELFGDWEAAEIPAPKNVAPVAQRTATQHSVPANKLQSWLVFGHALPPVPLEDQAPLEVMNYILAGGHLWTRMTIVTRYKYGYTNDASGFVEDKWFGPGTYNFRSYSRPEVIKPIFENMMNEIYRIRSERVTEEELFVAKGALTDGHFQVQYLDGYKIARNFALERLRYGNHERSASYVYRVRNVDADDVLAAAKKYLHPDQMQVVLLGRTTDLLR